MVLYPDVVPFADNRFDCCDLLQRSVIFRATSKASSLKPRPDTLDALTGPQLVSFNVPTTLSGRVVLSPVCWRKACSVAFEPAVNGTARSRNSH